MKYIIVWEVITWRQCLRALPPTLLSVVIVLSSWTQVVASRQKVRQRDEQVTFSVEQPLDYSVALPKDVLQTLRQDERVQTCLEDGDTNPANISASWFAAATVNLNHDKLPDLVVKAQRPCLFGANIGPFWIFHRLGRSYKLVLSVSTLELSVLKTTANSFRNIQTSSASAVQVFTRIYKFNGRRYEEAEFQVKPIK